MKTQIMYLNLLKITIQSKLYWVIQIIKEEHKKSTLKLKIANSTYKGKKFSQKVIIIVEK